MSISNINGNAAPRANDDIVMQLRDDASLPVARTSAASPENVKLLLNSRLRGIVREPTGMSDDKAVRYKGVDKIVQLKEFRIGGVDYKGLSTRKTSRPVIWQTWINCQKTSRSLPR